MFVVPINKCKRKTEALHQLKLGVMEFETLTFMITNQPLRMVEKNSHVLVAQLLIKTS